MRTVGENNIGEKITLCINHFQLQSALLREEIHCAKSRLHRITNSERYNFLLIQLKQFHCKAVRELAKKKEKKIRKLQWTRKNFDISNGTSNNSWLPNLNLNIYDHDILLNGEELEDQHISAAINILQKDYPIIIQPPSVFHATGFEYCPFETLEVVHNGAQHWVLLSSMNGTISIYDSLNMKPTDVLLKQITQLFSPDDTLPQFKQHHCHKQLGATDCGVFAIAYAIDVLHGNSPQHIRYDQNKMREHLISCLESGRFSLFPKYRTEDPITTSRVKIVNKKEQQDTSRATPKRYNFRSRSKIDATSNEVTSKNRFSPLAMIDDDGTEKNVPGTGNQKAKKQEKKYIVKPKKHQVTSVIHNLSKVDLTPNEIKLLEKGLNFCPSSKNVNKEELLDDIFAYSRSIRLKHYFHEINKNINKIKTVMSAVK